MTTTALEPRLDMLSEEFVLIQAWKKTSNYIRYHNWYADTLELDWTTINLREFLHDLSGSIKRGECWRSNPLRIVLAPKSQSWHVDDGVWRPINSKSAAARLRPLAHVNLRDQVVATAIMLCLANRVETRQGDPRTSLRSEVDRKRVISYGNRLLCDRHGDHLHHRWGSSKLYRSYFDDYKSFIARPTAVAESIECTRLDRVFIVQSDLRQFYDRVQPSHLLKTLLSFRRDDDERSFFEFARQALSWSWDSRDGRAADQYAKSANIANFVNIALPQGLVAAGFLANVVLSDLDDRMRSAIGTQIADGIALADACRYTDDFRFVLKGKANCSLDRAQNAVISWLTEQLVAGNSELLVAEDKTIASEFAGGGRPVLRQSIKMDRAQAAISGGFDAIAGAEILNTLRGLIRSQEQRSDGSPAGEWAFSPLPDVQDETVARFSASRYRFTFRSMRPLLEETTSNTTDEVVSDELDHPTAVHPNRTRQESDDDARTFALDLIRRWVRDPSNVRLLRIGLDLMPDAAVLQSILDLLRPYASIGGRRGPAKNVAWYCVGEVIRAGATETGFVQDDDMLPAGIDLQEYRRVLCGEALRLLLLSPRSVPWYVQQQAYLCLAVFSPGQAPVSVARRRSDTGHYRMLLLFLQERGANLDPSEFSTVAVLARRALSESPRTRALALSGMTMSRMRALAGRDPSFAQELSQEDRRWREGLPKHWRESAIAEGERAQEGYRALADVVLRDGPTCALRNEFSLLLFSEELLKLMEVAEAKTLIAIPPSCIHVKMVVQESVATAVDVRFTRRSPGADGSPYGCPVWCDERERWRFQLGFLLRFILTQDLDFTSSSWPHYLDDRTSPYRPIRGLWYQRIYGLFSGQQAFGDDWLPITDWMEQLLMALLHWPGCRIPEAFEWVLSGVREARKRIRARIESLKSQRGRSTGTLLLPMGGHSRISEGEPRALRACVVQTVIPAKPDAADLDLGSAKNRRAHRNHLSAALAAVKRMLDLRATHTGGNAKLDWLILPELAVHPLDIRTHLIPFVRAHKTMILTGLTYEELFQGEPLVNSALWLVPERSGVYGLQVRIRRQGKKHLAPEERGLNLQGFRPCQWLIRYTWSQASTPLFLTASICYDATDIRLAADLKDRSDIYAVPALNKDVNTFDNMALALHYHMFQVVVVANNGRYGGSNAYWPIADRHRRRVFHMHGQPQASIAFLDIDVDDLNWLVARRSGGNNLDLASKCSPWKEPPAGC